MDEEDDNTDLGFDWQEDEDGATRPYLQLLLDPKELRLFWRTKDGQQIFIEDMETSHIKNIIRADMDGRINVTEKTQNRFLLELSIRRQR